MHDAEPNQARRVRSADAAVFKAVEHEAALEREAELKARREARRNAEASHTESVQVPLNTQLRMPQRQPGQQAPGRVLHRNAPVQEQASLQPMPAPQRVEQRPAAISSRFVEKPAFGDLEQHMPAHVPERAVLHRGTPAVQQHEEITEEIAEEEEEAAKPVRAPKRVPRREVRRAEKPSEESSEEPSEEPSEKPEKKPKKTRKTVKEAKAYGIKRKRRFVLPLLIILLLEIIVAGAAVMALTIYNEDTDLIVCGIL